MEEDDETFTRDFEVTATDELEGGAWANVVGERKLKKATFAEFGFAEEVIALLKFEDGSFEVGIGESLRPYQQLYEGDDPEAAIIEWWSALRLHANM
jgi:hypothetical protein